MSAEVVPIRPEPQPERFRITDDRMAAWAMRKLAQAQARIDAVNATADDEVSRWRQWALDATTEQRATALRMSGLLEEWARSERAAGRATARTPFGVVTSRGGGPGKLVVKDEQAACDWAKENGHDDLAEMSWKFKAGAAKALLKPKDGQYVDPETGVVVPGVVHEAAEVTYTVKPDLSTSPEVGPDPLPEGA